MLRIGYLQWHYRTHGNRTKSITASLMISGEVLEYLKGLRLVMPQGQAAPLPRGKPS